MKMLKKGEAILGYEIIDTAELKDIDAVYFLLKHLKTGASHIHISNSDSDNTFSVAFKTVPDDSTGVAHILEHTALCGSSKFNVRDPFFSMIKRSLNTFMNAFTSSDWTMYPYSTQNEKDYYNLMDVYLDAAFFPNLTELSFKQEGHRVEFEGDDLVFKGVVFNEMKGAMSSQSQIMGRSLLNGILPDTTYANNSGGSPSAIPELTHEELVKFHQRHYHPSNAFFFTYGDLPLHVHLEKIEEKVLSKFDEIDPDTIVELQERWSDPKELKYTYPVSPNEDISKKSQVCVGWLTADVKDSFEILVLSLLGQVLLGNDASPLRKALIESQLGSALCDVTGFDSDTRDSMFVCGLKDVEEDKAKDIEKIVFDVLKDLSKNGIDKKLIDSAIHQIEFHRKEITNTPYPYGIKILLGVSGSWFHGGDPLKVLRLDDDFNRLSEELKKGNFLENKIKEYFLDNSHKLLLKLVPDKDKESEDTKKEQSKLTSLKEKLTDEDISKIKDDTEKLEKLQDMEEDISCLPGLELSDISKGIKIVDKDVKYSTESLAAYIQPTSGIFYNIFTGGVSMLPEKMLKLLPFFCTAFTKIGTKNYNYSELSQKIDEYTGGLGMSYQGRSAFDKNETFISFITLSGKCLNRNRDKMYELLDEMILNYNFSDLERIKNVLFEFKAGLESAVLQGGHILAINLSAKNFSKGTYLNEIWSGIAQLKYIKGICEDIEKDGALEKLSSDMIEIADLILNKENMRTCVVGDKEQVEKSIENIENIVDKMNTDGETGYDTPDFKISNELPKEGWYTSSAVSFVAKSFKTVRMDHEDAPGLSVISRLLRLLFLHKEIREKGGAYGGMAIYNGEEGVFSLASYRDPHVINTLNVFDKAAGFMINGNITDDDVKEAILQVCAVIDKPETPVSGAKKDYVRSIVSLSNEQREKYKEELLKVDLTRIRELSKKYFGKNPEGIGIISGEEKLKESNDTLNGLLTLHEI
ncbi:MAG: peptidase M16 [Deltaproteobacteria bacterium]|nr:peptidase M16 [Deltaproteobacteria bacterium]